MQRYSAAASSAASDKQSKSADKEEQLLDFDDPERESQDQQRDDEQQEKDAPGQIDDEFLQGVLKAGAWCKIEGETGRRFLRQVLELQGSAGAKQRQASAESAALAEQLAEAQAEVKQLRDKLQLKEVSSQETQQQLQYLAKGMAGVSEAGVISSSVSMCMVKLYRELLSKCVEQSTMREMEHLLGELILQEPQLEHAKEAVDKRDSKELQQQWDKMSASLEQLSTNADVDATVQQMAKRLSERQFKFPSTKLGIIAADQPNYSEDPARAVNWLMESKPDQVFDKGLTKLTNRELFKKAKDLLYRSLDDSKYCLAKESADLTQELVRTADKAHRHFAKFVAREEQRKRARSDASDQQAGSGGKARR
jgi:hypothetical protein